LAFSINEDEAAGKCSIIRGCFGACKHEQSSALFQSKHGFHFISFFIFGLFGTPSPVPP
jgi:hypothetical protein